MNKKSVRTSAAVALLSAGALLASVSCSKTDTTTAAAGSGSTTSAPPATSAPATSPPASSAPGTTAGKGTTSTTGGGSKSSTTTAKSASDEKAAEASLLTTSDMPAGFTTSKPSSSSNDKSPFLGVPECAKFEPAIKAADEGQTAKAKASWAQGNSNQIENSVEVYADAKVAQDSAEVLADPGFPACIEASFKTAMGPTLPPGATIDSFQTTVVDVGSAADLAVDSATGFKLAISMTVEGQTLAMDLSVTMLTSGRSLSQITTQSLGTDIALLPLAKSAAANLVANAPK